MTEVERIAAAMIGVRGAHNPTADELQNDEEVRPCAWCRLAAEQAIEAFDRAALRSTSRDSEVRLIDTHPALGGLTELVELELNDHNPGANWVCDCGNQIKGETFNRHVASMVDYRLTATDGDA